MLYDVVETDEAIEDIVNFATCIKRKFKNQQAIDNLLNNYDKQVQSLMAFPTGYRGISVEYRGYEIRIKPFDTYNLFFVVNEEEQRVTILRVLKNRQDWQRILRIETEYHFTYQK